jgi:hypothetical protein
MTLTFPTSPTNGQTGLYAWADGIIMMNGHGNYGSQSGRAYKYASTIS